MTVNDMIKILASIILICIFCHETTVYAVGSNTMKATARFNRMRKESSKDQWVILVHGLLSGPRAMSKIATALSRNGYRVINFGYDSREQSIQTVAKNLDAVIMEKVPPGATSVNFVTHSLGTLVVRYYLAENKVKNLGRFVMIA